MNIKKKIKKLAKEIKKLKTENCKDCGNYIDDTFMNANCNGCSMNPFYINCFVRKRRKDK